MTYSKTSKRERRTYSKTSKMDSRLTRVKSRWSPRFKEEGSARIWRVRVGLGTSRFETMQGRERERERERESCLSENVCV